jgi:hypothetical protein
LKLILGARLDWYEFENETLTAKTDYKVSRNLTKFQHGQEAYGTSLS